MAKKLDDIQQKELVYLKEQSLTILNFMIKKNGEMPMFDEFKKVIHETFEKKNIKGLNYLNKDIIEWSKGLSQIDSVSLNELLIKKFGKHLSQSDNKITVEINRIIKRGKINNEKEYNLLLEKVEGIYIDSARNDEVEVINNLLGTYSK